MKRVAADSTTWSPRRRSVLAGALAQGVSLAAPAVVSFDTHAAKNAGAREVQVTSSEILDFEFDQGQNRICFSDRSLNLWIAQVDPVTGNFNPTTGQGLRIASDAAFSTDFGNGPEWAYGAVGKRVVYTAYLPGLPRVPENARLAQTMVVNNAWRSSLIDPIGAWASPLATLNPKDSSIRITYQTATQTPDSHPIYWRRLEVPDTDHLIPMSEGTVGSRRWVKGTHNVVFSSKFVTPSGEEQVQAFLYNTDTDVLEQLTFDEGKKGAIFMWQAPEFNNEFVFFVMVGRDTISTYRKINGVWTVVASFVAKAPLKNVFSPEPFVHNGVSYIFFTLSASPYVLDLSIPTHIAISDIYGTNFRRLTSPTLDALRVRSDPEVYITSAGPQLYYNSYIPETPTSPAIQDGVWRVDTGLGPVVP